MAEWCRTCPQWAVLDREKDHILRSLSHEFRNPLHGIIASTEMLKNTTLNQDQNSLVETVDACGRTLLDIVNQIFDFTELMSQKRKSRQRQHKSLSEDRNISLSATSLDLYQATDLSILLEEVAESLFAEHVYNQRSILSLSRLRTSPVAPGSSHDLPNMRPVNVILNIAPTHWIYHAPPGAMRHIVMNLFGNALKFTAEGQVHLRLETEEKFETPLKQSRKAGQHNERNVILIVSDTGKGISEQFLHEKLYMPFAQENELTAGCGLGLSIVHSLVQSFRGSIDIESRLGEGTTVRVALPLIPVECSDGGHDQSSPTPPGQKRELLFRQNRLRRYEGRTVAILGLDPSDAMHHPYWAALASYITEWYGLRLISMWSCESLDLILANELPSEAQISKSCVSSKTALLVVSDQYVGHESIRVPWREIIKSIDVVNRPCGPHKLGRYISRCLDGTSLAPSADAFPQRNSPSMHFLATNVGSVEETAGDDPKKNRVRPTPIDSEHSAILLSGRANQKRDIRILVVDDNVINLNLLLGYLTKRLFVAVDAAENGRLAVEAVRNKEDSYDVIFMDISMPEMDGFEATRAIRALEGKRGSGSKRTVIIALTGLSSSEDKSKAFESGMDMFLTKPISFRSVGELLQERFKYSNK